METLEWLECGDRRFWKIPERTEEFRRRPEWFWGGQSKFGMIRKWFGVMDKLNNMYLILISVIND